MGWLTMFAAVGVAAEPKNATPDEEVIVYGDQFARWDHTRWLLQSELMLPLGLDFASEENFGFRSFAFQIRAVVMCDKDSRLSKKRWEVSCKIEDIGILATTENRWRTDKDRVVAAKVLEDVDTRLTGATVQMQVDDEGGITDFDLEGVEADTQRERRIQETTRQMMSRVMSGFHLRIPDQAQRSGQWVEYNSELIDLPSLAAARGSSTMVHQVSPMEGMQIVQTLGKGTITVNLPKDAGDPFNPGSPSSAPINTAERTVGGPPRVTATTGPATYVDKESPIAVTFDVQASGVAVFDKADGLMTERVWESTGRATASAPWGIGPYRNVGRIRILGETDAVDVGPSAQVGWPGHPIDGLGDWVSIEVLPGKSG